MTKTKKSKKHTGYKDPLKLRDRQFQKIKHKVDQTPNDLNTQEIPRKMREMIQKAKDLESNPTKAIKKKKKKNQEPKLLNTADFLNYGDDPKYCRPLKPIPTVQQYKGESYQKFKYRAELATKSVIEEARFQDKFKVEVRRGDDGKVKELVPFNKISEMMTEKQKRDQQLKHERKLEKKLKIKEFRDEKKRVDKEDKQYEDNFYRHDIIKFGEVAHEPPTLHSVTKLKFKALTTEQSESEKQRLKAVEAYRQMKADQQLNQHNNGLE